MKSISSCYNQQERKTTGKFLLKDRLIYQCINLLNCAKYCRYFSSRFLAANLSLHALHFRQVLEATGSISQFRGCPRQSGSQLGLNLDLAYSNSSILKAGCSCLKAVLMEQKVHHTHFVFEPMNHLIYYQEQIHRVQILKFA